MQSKQITDILYEYNASADITLEDLADILSDTIVRCKDCRWHEREQPGMVYCPNTVGGWVEDNWFCKGGERKDDG